MPQTAFKNDVPQGTTVIVHGRLEGRVESNEIVVIGLDSTIARGQFLVLGRTLRDNLIDKLSVRVFRSDLV